MNAVHPHTAAGKTPKRIAVVGMFDGVHSGHRHLLQSLKEEAAWSGLTPLAVTFSNHPLEIINPGKAPRLLTTPAGKRRLIEDLGIECEVIPFDEELRNTSAGGFLRTLRDRYGVEALMMGFNNRFGHDAPRDFNEYRRLGEECGVRILPATEFAPAGRKISSTEIRALIAAGDMEEATRLLGRPYSIEGTVEEGKHLGHVLGFPTANLRLTDPRQLLPRAGVYATSALGRPAMTNIGSRPTVETAGAPTIETHIIGLDTDLYGSPLTIAFRRRLRDERRFPSLDALRRQLEADRSAAMEAYKSAAPPI